MKVSEFYKEIDMNEISYRAMDNTYWQKVHKFLSQVWDKQIQEITKGQVEWLQKISEDFQ